MAAGLPLHVYPNPWDTRLFEVAWNRYWTGGSAGCFGVLGAFAARARRPGLLLAIVLARERAIWWIVLRNYASAFHIAALVAGFALTRWALPPIRRETREPGQASAGRAVVAGPDSDTTATGAISSGSW